MRQSENARLELGLDDSYIKTKNDVNQIFN